MEVDTQIQPDEVGESPSLQNNKQTKPKRKYTKKVQSNQEDKPRQEKSKSKLKNKKDLTKNTKKSVKETKITKSTTGPKHNASKICKSNGANSTVNKTKHKCHVTIEDVDDVEEVGKETSTTQKSSIAKTIEKTMDHIDGLDTDSDEENEESDDVGVKTLCDHNKMNDFKQGLFNKCFGVIEIAEFVESIQEELIDLVQRELETLRIVNSLYHGFTIFEKKFIYYIRNNCFNKIEVYFIINNIYANPELERRKELAKQLDITLRRIRSVKYETLREVYEVFKLHKFIVNRITQRMFEPYGNVNADNQLSKHVYSYLYGK